MKITDSSITSRLKTTFSNTSSVWKVPGHITGFFQIVDNKNMKFKGSRGSGFSIDAYVYTVTEIKSASGGTKLEVFFNGEKIGGEVSSYVASVFSPFLEGKFLRIHHASDLPIGGGFGTSGAGALGTAFALNEIFKTKMSDETLGQIAHKAEVKNGTGLGDVIAQLLGGAEIRIKAGAPGFGKILSYKWPSDISCLTIYLKEIPTKEIITNQKQIERINRASSSLISKMRSDPSVFRFIEYSKKFSVQCGLMSDKLKALLKELDDHNCAASQIMIGESAFVIGKDAKLDICAKYIRQNYPEALIWQGKLAEYGPRSLSSLT